MTPSTSAPERTPDFALVLELAGASTAMNADEFTEYAEDRLKPLLAERDPSYLLDVIILAMTMTGGVIEEWASDTDRRTSDIMGAIRAEYGRTQGQ